MAEMLGKMMEDAQKAQKRAFKVLIPAIIVGCVVLIGIGVLIGKYLL